MLYGGRNVDFNRQLKTKLKLLKRKNFGERQGLFPLAPNDQKTKQHYGHVRKK